MFQGTTNDRSTPKWASSCPRTAVSWFRRIATHDDNPGTPRNRCAPAQRPDPVAPDRLDAATTASCPRVCCLSHRTCPHGISEHRRWHRVVHVVFGARFGTVQNRALADYPNRRGVDPGLPDPGNLPRLGACLD